MTDHVNAFEPFTSHAPTHENALTRALMLVLRTVPVAHAAFLELAGVRHRAGARSVAEVDPAMAPGPFPALHELPDAEFATQRKALPARDEPPERIVSVVVTAEPRFEAAGKRVDTSRRNGIPDLFVVYGSTLALQLEAKLKGTADANQLHVHRDNVDAARTAVDPILVSLTWEEIFGAWWSLRQRGFMAAGERVVFDDFLDFIDRNHPALRPYRTVEMCGRDPDLLASRCRALLDLIAKRDDGAAERDRYFKGWHLKWSKEYVAERAVLAASERGDGLELRLFPGDLSTQCSKLYQIDWSPMLALQDHGWAVRAHFKFTRQRRHWKSFFPRNIMSHERAHAPTIEAYHEAFSAPRRRNLMGPDDWDSWFADMTACGMFEPVDAVAFRREAETLAADERLRPVPGIELVWRIDRDSAEAIDARHGLEPLVSAELSRALSALGLPPVQALLEGRTA